MMDIANNHMEKKKALAFLIFFLFKSIHADDDCRPASCSPTEPQVRFPFNLQDRQPARCGFPGFTLSCNKKNRTQLKLPSSQSFIIKRISYTAQVLTVDPDFCRPERIADVNLTDTPFDFSITESYTFFNCSSLNLGFTFQTVPMFPFPCLGSTNHSVFAVRTQWIPLGDIPANCKQMTTISVPIRRYGDIRNELTLMWFTPYCKTCELDSRTCGLQSDDGETACLGSSSKGIPRAAKYGLSIGIGVPALICIFALACYTFSKMRNYSSRRRHRIDLFSIAITPQPPSTGGLNQPTINSYPKSLWGENRNSPNSDPTCAICLSDYEPKESIRTIPECNHYFHSDCVDEWLKLNATCPVCRNTPESSSIVTPCFSMSSDNSSNSSRGRGR